MPISERLLRKWRKEALLWEKNQDKTLVFSAVPRSELCRQILLMTNELLDQHLLNKPEGKKKKDAKSR